MTNHMVSIRIPSSLVEELREVSKKDHFLDLSEAIRSIIRDSWLKNKDPLAYQIDGLRKDIESSISRKTNEDVLAELKKIRDGIIARKNG